MASEILYRVKSYYNDISVIQEGTILTLYAPDTYKQTEIDLNNLPFSNLEYARHILLSLTFCPHPKSILILGLGGGSIPMMFHHICKKADIDVVEIDPEMAAIAEQYFHFRTSSRLHLHIDDASLFVNRSSKQYSLIVMDAYIGNDLSDSLTSKHFFSEISRLLSNNGIFIANVMKMYQKKYQKALKKNGFHKKNIYVLHGTKSRNVLFFASQYIDFSQKILSLHGERVQKRIPSDIRVMKLIKKLKHP